MAAEAISEKIAAIKAELEEAVKGEEVIADVAEYFVLVRRVFDTIETSKKELGKFKEYMSFQVLPDMFEAQNTKSLTTVSGYRVTIASRLSVKMLDKQEGFKWLREHNLGELIQETVNSGTLSAQVKAMIENEGIEPPDYIFEVSPAPYASITKK